MMIVKSEFVISDQRSDVSSNPNVVGFRQLCANPINFQTYSDSDSASFWKAQVHHSSQPAVSHTRVNK